MGGIGTATGTLRKVTIDGTTFDVVAEINIKFKRLNFTKEGIPTSGKTLIQMKKQIQTVESVDLGCTIAELEDLKSKAESLADIPMSFELADGSIYRGTGHITFDGYESEKGKISLTLIPTGEWTPFLA